MGSLIKQLQALPVEGDNQDFGDTLLYADHDLGDEASFNFYPDVLFLCFVADYLLSGLYSWFHV